MRDFFRALGYFRSDGLEIAAALGFLVAGVGMNLLRPWPVALLVDALSGLGGFPAWLQAWAPSAVADLNLRSPAGIALLGGAVLVLHAGQAACHAIQNYLTIRVGLRGLKRVRNAVFRRLERMSLRFHQSSQSGDLIYRASWDTFAFQSLFQQGLALFATATLSLALMILVMWRLSPRLTFVAVAIAPLLFLCTRLFGTRMRAAGSRAQESDSAVMSHVQQTIAALPLIQSYGCEEGQAAAFQKRAEDAQTKRQIQYACEVGHGFGIGIVFALGAASLVYFGGTLVAEGALSVGALLVFLAYLTQLYEPLNQLSHVGATLSTSGASTRRVFEILDAPEEPPDLAPARRTTSGVRQRVQGGLEFDQVTFSYQEGCQVLNGLTFRIPAGQTVAILGPSGAGKSTLLALIPRFFDPTSGHVRLDGTDLRDLGLAELRRQVTFVSQEPVLLAASVAENIALGRSDATSAEVESAARAASALGFIRNLPQGFDTLVGEGAVRLSQGEKQRIHMARAFLKDAPILLLDEPTSALDANAETLTLENLKTFLVGRTCLIVAHQPATIRYADLILVLEDGRVAEMGPPAELLAGNGYFRRFFDRRGEAG